LIGIFIGLARRTTAAFIDGESAFQEGLDGGETLVFGKQFLYGVFHLALPCKLVDGFIKDFLASYRRLSANEEPRFFVGVEMAVRRIDVGRADEVQLFFCSAYIEDDEIETVGNDVGVGSRGDVPQIMVVDDDVILQQIIPVVFVGGDGIFVKVFFIVFFEIDGFVKDGGGIILVVFCIVLSCIIAAENGGEGAVLICDEFVERNLFEENFFEFFDRRDGGRYEDVALLFVL
jgi:hypothetical protein